MILRAVVQWSGGEIVTHTTDVSEAAVTVACDLAIDEEARLSLSFPGLVESFEVHARVISAAPSGGYGAPSVTVFDVARADAKSREKLAALVALTRGQRSKPREAPSYHCLLVDDNRFIRELFEYGMQRYARNRGALLTLDVVDNAEAGWTLLGERDFDLAIVDHFLPGQTGAELIARMRATPKLKRMPVVAVSVGGQEARDETMAAGADLYLDKPVVLRDLFTTLDKLTARIDAP